MARRSDLLTAEHLQQADISCNWIRANVATRVATQAASGVAQRRPADFKRGRNEPKRSLAAHPEPSAIAVRDREAEGSNPSPPTKIRIQMSPPPSTKRGRMEVHQVHCSVDAWERANGLAAARPWSI